MFMVLTSARYTWNAVDGETATEVYISDLKGVQRENVTKPKSLAGLANPLTRFHSMRLTSYTNGGRGGKRDTKRF